MLSKSRVSRSRSFNGKWEKTKGYCTNIPKINPLKELYWKQFGGGPDEAMLRKMDPTQGVGGEGNPNKKAERKNRDAVKPEEPKQ